MLAAGFNGCGFETGAIAPSVFSSACPLSSSGCSPAPSHSPTLNTIQCSTQINSIKTYFALGASMFDQVLQVVVLLAF